ncbi:hypothetical protein CDAR_43511 [Caerostris darwini]|uniref:Uncharacterized protein n=1 Tax=Caerostris darwini TaxID=1538125 RepID=A0AAV4WH01_9ARAC|nr:hypothetical protein CDAR_43511 [Caerostris darwini]
MSLHTSNSYLLSCRRTFWGRRRSNDFKIHVTVIRMPRTRQPLPHAWARNINNPDESLPTRRKRKKGPKKLSKEVWGTGIIQSARCHGILPVGHQAVKRARLLSPNRNPDDKRPPRDVINRFHDDSQEGRH